MRLSLHHKVGIGRSRHVAKYTISSSKKTNSTAYGQLVAAVVSFSTIDKPIHQNQDPSMSMDGIIWIPIEPAYPVDIAGFPLMVQLKPKLLPLNPPPSINNDYTIFTKSVHLCIKIVPTFIHK